MENDKKDLLNKSICSQFSKLNETKNGEEVQKCIDNINTLYRISIEESKDEHNFEEKISRIEMEKSQFDEGALDHRDDMELRLKELEEKISDRKWKNGIAIGTCIATIGFQLAVVCGIFDFEKGATFTSCVKNYILNDIFKRKK